MWGEVAELMEDLATAHCYCEYTKLEGLETVTWSNRNDAENACANAVSYTHLTLPTTPYV